MKSWELARFIIDAKKDIDSIMYIEENLKLISLEIRKDYIDRIRDHFYINCCNIMDEFFTENDIFNKARTHWKDEHPLIKRIYYERDKNAAHSDDNYRPQNYDSFNSLITEMKVQIKQVKHFCKDMLPTILTLNFFPHDKILFRLINGVNNLKEEQIKTLKYTNHTEGFAVGNLLKPRNVVYDIKELRGLDEKTKRDLAVTVEAGLNFYEMQQNIQDFYIIVNCIHGTNLWTDVLDDRCILYKQLSMSGLIDKFDIPKILNVITEDFKNWAYDTALHIWGFNIFDL